MGRGREGRGREIRILAWQYNRKSVRSHTHHCGTFLTNLIYKKEIKEFTNK